MKICMIGTGYVGLVTGACFAEMGQSVVCVDNNAAKIEGLKQGVLPIYEPGLDELVEKNCQLGQLQFTSELAGAVQASDIIFIAVGTPSRADGSADLQYVMKAAESIAKSMSGYKVIVIKSTVPLGTCRRIEKRIRAGLRKGGLPVEFDIVSNPEFLREGNAIEDFMKPERILIGTNTVRSAEVMKALYAPFVEKGCPMLVMDTTSSEMAKYAANAMLATKISFINEIASICEKVGGDIEQISRAIGADTRIGKKFLNAGIGYGGSCFPKDVRALIHTAKDAGYEPKILASVEQINQLQKKKILDWMDAMNFTSTPPVLAVWGLSFKPGTDDMRDAPSITVIRGLLERNAVIHVYDPQAMIEAKKIFENQIHYFDHPYTALEGANALLLLTEWDQFKEPDFEAIRATLKDKIIFDGRNQYDKDILECLGFKYYSVGRKNDDEKNIGNRRSGIHWQPFMPQIASVGE